MKDFEKILKDKLENFEMPYENSAWNAMQTKLNTKAKTVSNLKWLYALAGICGVLIITSMLIYTNTTQQKQTIAETKSEDSSEHELVKEREIKKSASTETNNQHKTNTGNSSASILSETQNKSEYRSETNTSSLNTKTTENQGYYKKLTDGEGNEITPEIYTAVPENELVIADDNMVKFETGHVNTLTICRGNSIHICNKRDENTLVKLSLNGDTILLSHLNEVQFELNESTTITYLNKENEKIGSDEITVLELPNASFTLEANLIEKGIPVVFISAPKQEDRTWQINGVPATFVDDNHIAVFESGEQIVQSTIRDNNGCEATVEKSFTINESYNLLAPTAFIPNSLNLENMFFMPFALEERTTGFSMIVVSTKDGGVVFETNDASVKWNGIDKRTGTLVDFNTPFIWQVKLDNPLPNEKNTYKGTVQMIRTP